MELTKVHYNVLMKSTELGFSPAVYLLERKIEISKDKFHCVIKQSKTYGYRFIVVWTSTNIECAWGNSQCLLTCIKQAIDATQSIIDECEIEASEVKHVHDEIAYLKQQIMLERKNHKIELDHMQQTIEKQRKIICKLRASCKSPTLLL